MIDLDKKNNKMPKRKKEKKESSTSVRGEFEAAALLKVKFVGLHLSVRVGLLTASTRGRVAGDSVSDVGPASVMVGNIVQGNRLASAQGRDLGVLDEDSDSAKKVSESSDIALRARCFV